MCLHRVVQLSHLIVDLPSCELAGSGSLFNLFLSCDFPTLLNLKRAARKHQTRNEQVVDALKAEVNRGNAKAAKLLQTLRR